MSEQTPHPRAESFDDLVHTIWRLRQPDGCPWDREQTHASIRRNMIEEAYEAAEAIDEGDDAHLMEELGDVLMQVLLHAQIAADEGSFDIDDVSRELNRKLIRRHPHVFGELRADDPDAVLGIWESVKDAEREEGEGPRKGLLDSVPRALPALAQCQKISKRVARVGFEWGSAEDVWDQVARERAELDAEEPGTEAWAEEFGDLLFSLVNVARWADVDAEGALEAANAKFRRRWTIVERLLAEEGLGPEEAGTAHLNELWDRAKPIERADRAG